ncbi:hypothetical protein LV85_04269 [Algoriphagus chordae]|uniref:Uncharacterized protein n=1 Tax=Algoriphagus chordae TaxID=237019 RepID=A0A2W7S7B9_9BACT|nr:hypothetical protein LV85_04269 [Algoriphagus chordae]
MVFIKNRKMQGKSRAKMNSINFLIYFSSVSNKLKPKIVAV